MGARERTPRERANARTARPCVIVVVRDHDVTSELIDELCAEAVRSLDGNDADLVVCHVGAMVRPDAMTVEALARLQLTATRLDRRVRILHACGSLPEIAELMGLRDVLGLGDQPWLEGGWQAEEGVEPFGIQEEADPADPPV